MFLNLLSKFFAAAQTFLQSVAGTLTSSGALTKSVLKQLVGTLTTAGSLTKSVGKQLTGTLSSTGSLAKQVGKFLAGIFTSAGTITKSVGKQLAGALFTSGTATKRVGKALSGAISFSSSLVAVAAHTVTILRTLTSFGTITKKVGKVPQGTFDPSGQPTAQAGKSLAAFFTSAGNLVRTIIRAAGGTGAYAPPYFLFRELPETIRRAFRSWQLPKDEEPTKKKPRRKRKLPVTVSRYETKDKTAALVIRGVVRRRVPQIESEPMRTVQSVVETGPALRFLRERIQLLRATAQGELYMAQLQELQNTVQLAVQDGLERRRIRRLREEEDELVILGLL